MVWKEGSERIEGHHPFQITLEALFAPINILGSDGACCCGLYERNEVNEVGKHFLLPLARLRVFGRPAGYQHLHKEDGSYISPFGSRNFARTAMAKPRRRAGNPIRCMSGFHCPGKVRQNALSQNDVTLFLLFCPFLRTLRRPVLDMGILFLQSDKNAHFYEKDGGLLAHSPSKLKSSSFVGPLLP